MSPNTMNYNELFENMAAVTAKLSKGSIADECSAGVRSTSHIDSAVLVHYPVNERPQVLVDSTLEGMVLPGGDMADYIACAYYLLDPFYQLGKAHNVSGCYHLSEVADEDFIDGDYFRQYYCFSSFVDEVTYILQLPSGGHLQLSMASQNKFTPQEVALYQQITPWILSVLEREWSDGGLTVTTTSNQEKMYQCINKAFENFGSSMLTEREAETARMLLNGHSAKSMAEKMNISIETVKVHRRNLYQKLDIASQSELFSLFLISLPLAGQAPSGDPLEAYHQPAAKS